MAFNIFKSNIIGAQFVISHKVKETRNIYFISGIQPKGKKIQYIII